MPQAAEHLGFILEAPHHAARHEAGSHDLQRDDAARILRFGLVHRAHAAGAEPAQDAVAADALGQRRFIVLGVAQRLGRSPLHDAGERRCVMPVGSPGPGHDDRWIGGEQAIHLAAQA